MLGIGASSGIAIDKVYVLTHQKVGIRKDAVSDDKVSEEIQRLEETVELSRKQL